VHVALIRGINVGRAKRVAMADLKALVEELGYTGVKTLLNSGNVVFASTRGKPAAAASRIEEGLIRRLGVSARVFVITAGELKAIVAENPLAAVAKDPSRLLLSVLGNPADRSLLEPLARQSWDPDALALGSRVAYLWCSRGVLQSPMAEAVNRVLGEMTTARNWATMQKLHALTQAEP
jgi:uncharacterized protein (DUF1697 family)